MFRTRLILFAAGCIWLGACSSGGDSPRKALTGATLVDGTGAAPIPNAVIVVENGRITAAGPAASTNIPDGFEKVNVGGKFIVPGLIDAHVVFDSDPAKAALQLKNYLASGITSVGADTVMTGTGPAVFPSLGKQAGIADLVIASNGSTPAATFTKLQRMAKAEIPPVEVLHAATQNGAMWLGQTGLGAIQAGQKADLLVLNANPALDITNLNQIYRIMQDGHWVNLK